MSKAEILLADDDASIRAVIGQAIEEWDHRVYRLASGKDLLECLDTGKGQVVILDVVLPDADGLELVPKIKKLRPTVPIIIISAQNNVMTAIRAGQHQVFDYLPKPFDLAALRASIDRALPKDRAQEGDGEQTEALPLVGRSPPMQQVYKTLSRLIGTDMTVLIEGESGTGKELAARILHDYGNRRTKEFVALNMAAIPKELIESELFGYAKGAFTGAFETRKGKFQLANKGTLFLDEIGDMPYEAQTRLLRVLQTGDYSPVGSPQTIRTDCRIIAATNKNLVDMVKIGQFREDLYYRLAVVPLNLPPLRNRREDIPDLVKYFSNRVKRPDGTTLEFSKSALMQLCKHTWPGNVRELENLVRRLSVLAPDHKIDGRDIQSHLTLGRSTYSLNHAISAYLEAHIQNMVDGGAPIKLYELIIREVEVPLLGMVMKATNGNQVKAAHFLGINRNTLRKKLRDLGITMKDDGNS